MAWIPPKVLSNAPGFLDHSNQSPGEWIHEIKSVLYRGDVLHDGKLEFITITREQFLEILSFVERPDNAPDGVPFLQKDDDDVDGEEPVRARDEDLISWSDGGHVSLSRCGSEDVDSGWDVRTPVPIPSPLIHPLWGFEV